MIWELFAYELLKKFYKYIFLFIAVGCIFIILLMVLYGKPTNVRSMVNFKDLVDAWNTPHKKKKTILKKHESRCRNILEKIFQSPFISIRPDFLKYPKTGKNLELDGYNEKHNIAFEYQGIQHRKYCPGMFHETYNDFVKQQNRDAFKQKRCKELGIHVIYIPDTVPYEKLEDFLLVEVKKWIEMNGMTGDQTDALVDSLEPEQEDDYERYDSPLGDNNDNTSSYSDTEESV